MSGAGRVDLTALADLATPWAIRTVATLGVADHVAAGVDDPAEIARRCGADPDALTRVLRFLSCRGVFAETAPGRFALTEAARLLCRDHPLRMRSWFDMDAAAGRMDAAFAELPAVVRGARSGYERVHGRSVWDDARADHDVARAYDELMGAHARFVAPVLVRAYDWAQAGHVVDVGGGTGALLGAVLAAHPGLRGTLVELPAAATAARDGFAAAGIAGRAEVVEGSFFDALPRRAGWYVLANVLHDWPDDRARAILRRCAEAVAPAADDARVLVLENLDTGSRPLVTTAMDVRLMVLFGGRERRGEDVDALAADAGLAPVARHPLGGAAVLSEYRR